MECARKIGEKCRGHMECARKIGEKCRGHMECARKNCWANFRPHIEIRRLKSALVKIRQQLWAKACSMICCGMDCCSMICFANAQRTTQNAQLSKG